MTNKLLLPHRFKMAGWCILVPSAIAGIFIMVTGYEPDWLDARVYAFLYDDISLFSGRTGTDDTWKLVTLTEANLTNTIAGVLCIAGALMVSFSREKKEDEYIASLRLSSLLWSVWVNYILLLLAFVFMYDITFLHVMVYNMFTILIIFIVRFNYVLYRSSKTVAG